MEKAAGRKRKNSIDESELSASSAQLKTRRLSEISASSTTECDGPDHVSASCCSSNGSSELAKLSSKFVDLEENDTAAVGFFETSAGDDSLDFTGRLEMTPAGESGELESTAMPPHNSNSPPLEKMPSEAELEDFFAAAEKNLQKKFVDKYNFDTVKEQPLEGRYEWVQIKLNP
ncbi:hypothetical protein CASFOL_018787 [Castilleja foliolosa]|uniref:Cyclin-dependent kinase inhibitor domain-containing protein n=1 Tax=Castilleja foliolosa TaxID=1961234 RepID=A0ABD3D2L9_9LAMI